MRPEKVFFDVIFNDFASKSLFQAVIGQLYSSLNKALIFFFAKTCLMIGDPAINGSKNITKTQNSID